jgi:ammonium transporter, Amt family
MEQVFKDQVTTQFFLEDVLYSVAALAVVLVVLGLTLVDVGLARRRNVLDTAVQKLVAALIAGFSTFIVGYAIWAWQFYQVNGLGLGDALSDWWLFGDAMTNYAQFLNPEEVFAADVQQVFVVFFATFSMGTLALIHSSVIERIKPLPLYVMAFAIGLFFSPFAGYLAWGSASWLTNEGVHDLEGIFPLYIFAGMWALVLNWRLGPRLGSLKPHASGATPAPHNMGLAVVGVLLIIFAIPLIALGSGYLIPEQGFVGISMTTSGYGIVFINAVAAICTGGLVGAILAYRLKEWVWAALGPIAGVVAAGTLLDVVDPWVVILVSAGGPIAALLTRRLIFRWGIDDAKVVPIGLGAGVYGAIACGFVAWGTSTGGYFTGEGDFAFQHAEITPWWQLIGVVAIMGLSGVGALVMSLIFERAGGLRVEEPDEIAGIDEATWGTGNFSEEGYAPDGDGQIPETVSGTRSAPPEPAGGVA